MNRRGLLAVVGGLALAATLGLKAGADAGESRAKANCACCGLACECPACTCDTNAVADASCDCCGGATCCPLPTAH